MENVENQHTLRQYLVNHNVGQQRTHRGKDELLEDAVNYLVLYNEWFERKVRDSLAVSDRGALVPDDDVRAWLEERERC